MVDQEEQLALLYAGGYPSEAEQEAAEQKNTRLANFT
jgi:hypothetical protein